MRIFQSETKRPLDILAIGARGHLAAGCSVFSAPRDVEFWDLSTGTIRHTHRVKNKGLFSLNFRPEGEWALIGEANRLSLLSTLNWEVTPKPIFSAQCAIPLTGTILYAVSESIGSGIVFRAWRLSEAALEGWFWGWGPLLPDCFRSPAVTPDGASVAICHHILGATHPKQWIQVRDGQTGALRYEMTHDPTEQIQQLSFANDGTRLFVRCHLRTVKVFDAATGKPAGELVHPGRPFVTGLAVHPGGKAIATCRNDGTVWFWEPSTFRPIRTFDWKLGKLVSVAFSPDGLLAAAGTEDGQIVVWDLDW